MLNIRKLAFLCLCVLLSFGGGTYAIARNGQSRKGGAVEQFNRKPLQQRAYAELPLGAIKAEGWLYEMLDRQRKGMTGRLDELYPQVMGSRNGW